MKSFCITLTLFLLITQYIITQEHQAEQQTERQEAHQPAHQAVKEPERQLEGTGRVTVTISQDTLTVGVPFTLTLLVDYPEPEEVSVITPDFSANITVDLFVKSPVVTDTNLIQQSGRRGRNTEEKVHTQTSLEFRLIPNNTGRILLESFTIISPHGTRITGPIVLIVNNRAEVHRVNSQRLIWEGAPRQITTGERVTFYLRYQNIRPENAETQLTQSFFMPQVPQGVILTNSPITPEESERGIVLKLTLIPLAEGGFNLPSRSLTYGNVRYDIPALTIRITKQ